MDNDIKNLDNYLQVITLIIHLVTMGLLVCGGRFVYKTTGVGNKFIIAMIMLLILALVLNIVTWLGLYFQVSWY